MRLVLPVGLAVLDDPQQRQRVFLRCRRVFKMVIHTCILLLLISGSYNAWRNWGAYHEAIPLSHAFFGLHVILALLVFGISIAVLMGHEPPASHRSLMAVNLILLALVVAAGSSLKWVRDTTPRPSATITK
jgi:heme A synthase